MASASSISFAKRKTMLKAIIAGTVVMLSFPIGAANAQGEPKYKWEAGLQVDDHPIRCAGRKATRTRRTDRSSARQPHYC
jgi:hypothetical protein